MPYQSFPINERVLQSVTDLGLTPDAVRMNIKENKHNNLTTTYYLLLKKTKVEPAPPCEPAPAHARTRVRVETKIETTSGSSAKEQPVGFKTQEAIKPFMGRNMARRNSKQSNSTSATPSAIRESARSAFKTSARVVIPREPSIPKPMGPNRINSKYYPDIRSYRTSKRMRTPFATRDINNRSFRTSSRVGSVDRRQDNSFRHY